MRDLAAATPDLTRSFRVLNALLNTLAYNPPGGTDEGYLFWLSWANHAGATVFATQDAHGPIRHGIVVFNCEHGAAAGHGGEHQPGARHARRPPQRADARTRSARSREAATP